MIKIPFEIKTGNMLNYNNSYGDIEWIDNYIFEDTLKVLGSERGRSSVTFILEDSKGKIYSMFLKDMTDLIMNSKIDNGKICGRWSFKKRGSNYGIYLFNKKTKI